MKDINKKLEESVKFFKEAKLFKKGSIARKLFQGKRATNEDLLKAVMPLLKKVENSQVFTDYLNKHNVFLQDTAGYFIKFIEELLEKKK